MSHSPNRYRAEKRAAEWQAQRTGPAIPAVLRAQRVIAVWNRRARHGEPAEFFPTFETALRAACYRLSYCCPAFRQVATVDLRKLRRPASSARADIDADSETVVRSVLPKPAARSVAR